MEKKDSTTFNPLSICEKLINAFIKPTLQPFRRLFRRQESVHPPTTANSSSTLLHHNADSGPKDHSPTQKPHVVMVPAEKKAAEVVSPKNEPRALPRLPSAKEKEKVATPLPVSFPPEKGQLAALFAKDNPQPAAAPAGPKKDIDDDKVGDYINRTRTKVRNSSSAGVGRAPSKQ